MIAFRLILVVTVVAAIALVVAYLLTGERRWAQWAGRVALGGGALLLLYLLLFLLERLIAL